MSKTCFPYTTKKEKALDTNRGHQQNWVNKEKTKVSTWRLHANYTTCQLRIVCTKANITITAHIAGFFENAHLKCHYCNVFSSCTQPKSDFSYLNVKLYEYMLEAECFVCICTICCIYSAHLWFSYHFYSVLHWALQVNGVTWC